MSDPYVVTLEEEGVNSVTRVRDLLNEPGYQHAQRVLAEGAVPVAITIDGHVLLARNEETWIVDAPRGNGSVEHLFMDWKSVVARVEADEDFSAVISGRM